MPVRWSQAGRISPEPRPSGSDARTTRAMQPQRHSDLATDIPSAQGILDALTMAVALLDRSGTIIAVNHGWRAFARDNGGNSPAPSLVCNYLDVCDRVSGVDGLTARNTANGIRAVLAGGPELYLEYPCHAPDQQRWFQLRVSRPEHAGGIYAVVAHHDITKCTLAEQERQALLAKAQAITERQHLLIRELHHRVKNSLATVQALLGATARSSNSVAEFYHSFAGRLAALGKTHTLLTEDYWQTASVREMLRNELEPYANGSEDRIVLSGPPVELSADLTIPTGMAIHELAANAVTHGALSVPSGRVAVVWDVLRDAEGQRRLCLEWTERGGPAVEPPSRQGFGSRLLERVLPA